MLKRTKKQEQEEKKAIRKYISLLKKDKRTKWHTKEHFKDRDGNDVNTKGDPYYLLEVIRDSGTGFSPVYGWETGAFRYIYEGWSESGGATGFWRREKVMSKSEWLKEVDKIMVTTSKELWDHYYDDPSKKNLDLVKSHCKLMAKHNRPAINKERKLLQEAIDREGAGD